MNSINFSDLIKRLKQDKRLLLILCIGVFGMLLITMSQFSDDDIKNNEDTQIFAEYNEQEIQQSLERIIGSINGVGKVRVMITYDTTTETVYATDSDIKNRNDESDSENKHIIIDSNNGETGLTLKVIYPQVRGVAVVCTGGGDPVIKGQIVDTVSALFDISSKNIMVAEMAE